MTDKTKSQTYNFLSENKSIEDIKNQPNTTFKEKSRHGGKTFKIIEKINANNQIVNNDLSENNTKNLEPIAISLTDNQTIQEINNDIWTKLKNYLNWPSSNTEELIQTQKKYIEQLEQSNLEKDKENQQLKNEIEKLKLKQSNVNFDKFKYNAITIYDEKQSKKTGINKIYEEILPINNELYFITTFQNTNQSITEEIICFHKLTNGNVEVIKQVKEYENINEYKDDFLLIEKQSNQNKKYKVEPVSIKDFFKKQQKFKLKPSNKQWIIWGTFTTLAIVPIICAFLPFVWPVVALVFIDKIAISAFLVTIGIGSKIFSSLFSPITKKVESWISNKIYKNEELKEKNKKERESIIKNLTSDKLETKLQTQYDILKQELDNRKNMKPDKLISNNKINHNSNNLLENSSIESENNHNFDSDIKNTVNNQNPQSSTSKNHNWNKVKCLLT